MNYGSREGTVELRSEVTAVRDSAVQENLRSEGSVPQ
jgi:hypothetical protein